MKLPSLRIVVGSSLIYVLGNWKFHAAEIRAGLWRRNGLVMMDQILNYAEVPYCRHFRDLDIVLLQFCFATYQEMAVEHILRSYGIINTQPAELPVGANVDEHMAHLCCKGWLNDHGAVLKSDCLFLFIVLVSELPLPPACDKESLDCRIATLSRREFIHKLAAGSSTYAALHDAALIIPNNEQDRSDLLDKVIYQSIANWAQNSELEAAQL